MLQRVAMPAEEVIVHLVGMQGQAPQAPYVGLWSRIDGFEAHELSQLLLDRRVVRIPVMRNTIHLVTGDDCLAMRPWTQPIFDRDLRTNTTFAPGLRDLDLTALADAARELVEAQPRTAKELGTLLQQRWPDRPANSLAHGARNLLPLVQVPPRGLWGRSGQPTLTTADAWLGRPLTEPDPAILVRRYLAAFGPASVQDAQTWSGLTRLREVFERLPLRRFRDEGGRELFDLEDAPRPDPDTPAPVRFLAEYDNLLLSHADRTRLVGAESLRAIGAWREPPRGVLVDGYVKATWKIIRERQVARLVVQPLDRLGKRDRAELTAEGERLLAFAAADAHGKEVSFAGTRVWAAGASAASRIRA
ncbi:winged helix DNA-binding domain-containing protein [Micromonospora sp. C28SCA-DRY-2]|uniref:winged helix DNA-binding domain-containing protein n=1 Tax=Micromonospora sp. C28SCA-DRY-2 TaxID=3059522 RepID=UPI0026773E45|nr:winged helix DNA-binding domain-containing protein [Micromonospora sp. C28SCA-DRY-2]MDO3703258.1 winged helix DNA-binding domain-containing protein [Micromonospora sp. C28SCA-DRY-2]